MSQEVSITIIEATTGLTTAIISGLFGYWLAVKQIKGKYSDILLNKRLETYPTLIKITQELGKPQTSVENHKQARQEIKNWVIAPHGGYLTLSPKTLKYFNKLKDLLKKHPENGKEYSDKQLRNIFEARNSLRGSLTDDLSAVTKSKV